MLKVVHEESEPNENRPLAGSSLLDEIVRDGARQMLAAALQAEVAAYIEATVTSSTGPATGWWSATATTRRGR
jgi:hypothetical protein